ncbi:hypothetical protein TNCV_2127781 [Trichonephila clavipes]|nr:hypothetical protein TNCV_2127781 [Trichonephila clavipes]
MTVHGAKDRGHTSNIGLVIIIDVLSGLVLGCEVLSECCQNCAVTGRYMKTNWAEFYLYKKGYADECDKNFDVASLAMEMHAALISERQLICDCQIRLVSILSDNDLKT